MDPSARHPHSHVERPPGWPAWLVSLIVHACLLISLALTTRALVLHGIEKGPSTSIVLGLAEESAELAGSDGAEGKDEIPQSPGVAAGSDFTMLPAEAEAVSPAEQPRQPVLGLMGLSLTSPAGRKSSTSTSAAPPGQTTRRLGQVVTKARLSVFGAVAEGTKFAFVFDRSTSMAGARLAAAKAQLLANVEALDSVHQFQIIFFNHEMQAWDLTGGQRRIPFASQQNKELARRFVDGITAFGGTYRRTPLMHALAMSPDAVFFLTDADDAMPPYDVAEAIDRAQRSGTTIACIEFGNGPAPLGDNFLTQLARGAGGSYVYVDTTRLGR
jgi:hypothetical protein